MPIVALYSNGGFDMPEEAPPPKTYNRMRCLFFTHPLSYCLEGRSRKKKTMCACEAGSHLVESTTNLADRCLPVHKTQPGSNVDIIMDTRVVVYQNYSVPCPEYPTMK